MELKLSFTNFTAPHRLNHRFSLLRRHHNHCKLSCRISLSSKPSELSEELQRETLKTLEWNRLCNQLSPFISTTMGHSLARNGSIPMGRNLDESQRLLAQTTAALGLPSPLNFSGVNDVSDIVETAASGVVLSIGELCSVKRTLRSAKRLLQQLLQYSSDDDGRSYPLLEILQNCNFLVELEQKIEYCVDCKLSIVLDRASDDLKFIRSERKKNMDALDSLLRSVSHKVFQAGGIDKAVVTNRRSRMCVGIKASHRSLLPGGVVLDVSSSGATYFMEPKEAVDLNNMEVWLANSERDEERAILSMLASELGKSAADINDLLYRIQEVDLAVARAGYANWLGAVCPILYPVTDQDALLVDVEGVRHPLLLEPCLGSLKDVPGPSSGNSENLNGEAGVMSFKELPDEEHKFPIPIDIKIGCKTSVVIISGPNAGGKTASMKTLGLVSLMSKAGLYLPAKSIPKLPWFDFVLADIGDHQSLEQSLSTFSGHILRIGKILEVASKDSLVLIDEIGSGTDPSEGVALSSSILQYLKDRVSLAVVTTHYADLSRLKYMDARFENAAMEFSLDTLQPTFQVLWGTSGESNALRIARRIGFNDKIIDHAESWLEKLMPEKQAQRKGQLYQSLLEERNRMGEQARRAASLHSDVMDLYNEIEDESQNLEWREKALIAKETQQVEEELDLVKLKLDRVVQEFENQLRIADIDQYGSLVKKAESAIGSLVENHRPMLDRVSEDMAVLHTPQPGEQVHVKRLGGKLATVVEVSEDDETILIQHGKVRFRVDRSGIQPIEGTTAGSRSHSKKQARIPGYSNYIGGKKDDELPYGAIVQTSKNTLDLRGMRVEEASHTLSMAIAARESRSLLFIIHGMGTGILKECVIEMLRNHQRIDKFEQESPMNYGCTVAFIK
ncbi:hypothetical protein SOVF_210620 [Spinacia oleracea]|uniref:Uncharacterized protein isoform X2 n=1 Tax=Spinacia oleracea TaxID=3562 RepID=A0A9R0JK06_SPIOL|nr:uncharacterized protein LOC110777281 isoform X2 [Spinacia oleracea]KNA03291.1 hypothetical protein SOVF_210620 [Spinacia oleracea]